MKMKSKEDKAYREYQQSNLHKVESTEYLDVKATMEEDSIEVKVGRYKVVLEFSDCSTGQVSDDVIEILKRQYLDKVLLGYMQKEEESLKSFNQCNEKEEA